MRKEMDHMTVKGISMIVLGILILANDSYEWLSWPAFIAIVSMIVGVKKLLLKKCC